MGRQVEQVRSFVDTLPSEDAPKEREQGGGEMTLSQAIS